MSSHPNQTITAYERERMMWINFNDRPSGTSFGNIPDFVTSGVAYRIVIPGTDQAFIIENHQKVSQYFDDPIAYWPGKGLYIYRVDGLDYDHPHYDLNSAEGDFNWSNPYWVPWPGWSYGILPVYRRLESNRLAFDARDHLQHTRPDIRLGCLRVFAMEIKGQAVITDRLNGRETDFYNIGYNQVLSPWSNPASLKQDLSTTDIAVEITGKSIGPNGEDIFTATFYNGGAINASPSKPQDLKMSVLNQGGDRHPKLDWAAMLEPDVLSGGKLLVYSRSKIGSGNWSGWALRDSVAGTVTSWVDYVINTAGNGPDSLQYKIQARDSQAKFSVFSDVVSVRWFMQGNKIAIGSSETPRPTTFDLGQNYPNPFNPSTTIKYQLAEDGIATLQMFDILGREVATLVNGFYPAGYYSTTFNADQLSSGVYFVRFTASNDVGRSLFTKMSKLLLLR